MILLMNKNYDGESIYDLNRDVCECIDVDYNPVVSEIPVDEHGFQQGTFRVRVEWHPNEA